MMRYTLVIGVVAALLLSACGGPSEVQVQATVVAAVEATAQAQQVATAISATQVAATACEPAALKAYAARAEDQLQAFEQQAQLVGTTPRVGLGVPLQRLLDIQTETRKLETPECLQPVHARVLDAMDLHQQAYQNFAGQGDEALTTRLLQEAAASLATAHADLTKLAAGTLPDAPAATATPS
jgi:hypothetical protein